MQPRHSLDPKGLEVLLQALQGEGYTLVGPTVRDQAIIYDELASASDLPIAWTDEQAPGSYRLRKRQDQAYFGYNVGPHSWKKYLFPSRRKLWEASRVDGKLQVLKEKISTRKLAFIGVRSCEMEAIFIQDKVFIEGAFVDPFYQEQREQAFVISVNCTQASSSCFCESMKTGPECKRGFDLSLTEVVDEQNHFFVVTEGSDRGRDLLSKVPSIPCRSEEIKAEARGIQRAREQMKNGLGLNTKDIKPLLLENLDHPRWEEVAERCLSCANCTMACPTCFCSDVEDQTDLSGDHTERWKSWDSCFTPSHSYLPGGAVHASTKSRYRQWLTHKLGSWIDQFGTSGCVGCGRCIAWCPVGIDLREEVAAIRGNDDGEDQE